MLKILVERCRQKHRTIRFPAGTPSLPQRFRGRPVLDPSRCPDGCRLCAEACPTDAIRPGEANLTLDLGRCLFCTDCVSACPAGAVAYSQDYRLAARGRLDLHIEGVAWSGAAAPSAAVARPRVAALDAALCRVLGRSLRLRQVSAGGCNGCESDINVLNTIVFDLGRFGIEFVASPRHADGLLITGPVTGNMHLALLKAYAATPTPKIIIAVGACAISGGPYMGHPEVLDGAERIVPVDLYVPGCPPHPLTILDGLLRLLGRLQD